MALRTSTRVGLDAETLAEEPVELVAEVERRAVGDLGLHRHDGGQALADEGLAHPGKGVAAARACTLTGIEDGELESARVMQQGSETGARDEVGAGVVLTLEGENAFLRDLVEAAVADEMEDVEVLEQRALQVGQGGLGHHHELEQARRHEVLGRESQEPLLPLDVEPGQVRRARDHDENTERRAHRDGRGRVRRGEHPQHRRLLRQGEEALQHAVVEVLPRQRVEVRDCLEAQSDPQFGAMVHACREALAKGHADGAGEQGVGEPLAVVAHLRDPVDGRHKPPGRDPWRADRIDEAGELDGGEGVDEGRRRLACGGREDADGIPVGVPTMATSKFA